MLHVASVSHRNTTDVICRGQVCPYPSYHGIIHCNEEGIHLDFVLRDESCIRRSFSLLITKCAYSLYLAFLFVVVYCCRFFTCAFLSFLVMIVYNFSFKQNHVILIT